MISIELSILNDNVAIHSIPLSIELLVSSFTGIFTIIVSSFYFGSWVGHKIYYEKGNKEGELKGFNKGKNWFLQSTKIVDCVICQFNPNKTAIVNGISIIKKNNGEVISVECPYKEKDNSCQITKDTCCKI